MDDLPIKRKTNVSANALFSAMENKTNEGAAKAVTSEKGRRSIFKKKPFKTAATRVPTGRLSQHSYLTEGDIVSVVDKESKYYAQIRGLLQNQLGEKFAVITWLLPTINSPKGRFDPATYILGAEADTPRSIDCFEFVCHSPSGYFKAEKTLYPRFSPGPQHGFISTSKGPKILHVPYEGNSDDD